MRFLFPHHFNNVRSGNFLAISKFPEISHHKYVYMFVMRNDSMSYPIDTKTDLSIH